MKANELRWRKCDHCLKPYRYSHATSKFCTAVCRVEHQRGKPA